MELLLISLSYRNILHFPYDQTFMIISNFTCSCNDETQSDWVTFSNYEIGTKDRRYNPLCGTVNDKKKKHVADSDGNFFRVTFHSNDVYDATGFKAVYEFKDKEGQFLILFGWSSEIVPILHNPNWLHISHVYTKSKP